jgi:hypothetical protein
VKRSGLRLLVFLLLTLAYAAYALPQGKVERFSAQEIIAKHLEAIGAPEARTSTALRKGEGTAEFNERVGGRIHLPGTARFFSEGHKVKWAFSFAAKEYPGEQWVFDGQGVRVAGIDERNRSRLGNFIFDHPEVLREAVWGGVLSSGWALLGLPVSGAKVKGGAAKKIDGRELYEVTYVPKGGGDSHLSVHLYFEPDTFRHVLTVYRLTGTTGPGSEPDQPDSISGEVVTMVEERFSDFQTKDGLTMPAQWEFRLRIEPSKGFEYEWKIHLSTVKENTL